MNPLPLGVAAVTLAIGCVGTLLWGWPGTYAWLALAPGVLLGATGGHLINARRGLTTLRPGVLSIGVVMGSIATLVALMFFWAHAASPHHEVTRTQPLAVEAETLWSVVADLERLPNWNPWYTDVEAIGRSVQPVAGARFRAATQLESHAFLAEIVVSEYEPPSHIAWRLDTETQGRMQVEEERLDIKTTREGCTVSYTIGYELPTPATRVIHALFLGAIFENLVNEASKGLAALAVP